MKSLKNIFAFLIPLLSMLIAFSIYLLINNVVSNYQNKISKDYSIVVVSTTNLTKESMPKLAGINVDNIQTLPNDKIIENIKNTEGKKILSHLKKDSYKICLDLHGKQFSSEEFSAKIDSISLNYNSSITFIIGGTLGISSEVLNCADEKICFSKMTFPHQLIRVFLLEQLFRAFKISNNETYHW